MKGRGVPTTFEVKAFIDDALFFLVLLSVYKQYYLRLLRLVNILSFIDCLRILEWYLESRTVCWLVHIIGVVDYE